VKAQVRTSFTARTAGKIDEAHLLDHDQLESIRMMTNHDMDSSTPFATILAGQPTLRHSVKLGVLERVP